jgi:hypothetical protein
VLSTIHWWGSTTMDVDFFEAWLDGIRWLTAEL